MFASCLRISYALGTQWHAVTRLVYALSSIVGALFTYSIRHGTHDALFPHGHALPQPVVPMREAWQASHTSICCGPDKILNVREEALIAQKRTCLYYLSAALILLKDQEKKKKEQAKEEITPARKRKARTVWVREWLNRRHHFGHYYQLLTELHKEDPIGYRNYLRITPNLFKEMVEKLILRRLHS